MSTSPLAHRPPHAPSSRRLLIALAVMAALTLSAFVALALVLVLGDTGTQTRTVLRTVPAATTPGSWARVYAQANAGAVDFTVRTTTTIDTPFGPRAQQATDLGSGFVVDGRGDIVTAAHVVSGATSIRVTFQNGTVRTARVLGTDPGTDVALVRTDPAGLALHPLPMGSSAALSAGDQIAVFGDPLGFTRSISRGSYPP